MKYLKFTLATAICAGLVSANSVAAEYPQETIRFIVPYAPGATDVLARRVAGPLQDELGVTVVVETHPGAGGTIGGRIVSDASPDGATFLFAYSSVQTLGPHQHDAGYTFEDLTPVARVSTGPNMLGARADAPFDTLEELIDFARENPGDVSYASAGTGGMSHLLGEGMSDAAGIELFHVPYQGVTPAIAATVAGDVDLVIGVSSSILPQSQDGALKALGQFGDARASIAPDVPTLRDVGVDASFPTLIGVWAPSGIDDDVKAMFVQALETAVNSDELQEYGASVLLEFSFAGPDEFRSQLEEENQRHIDLIERLGL